MPVTTGLGINQKGISKAAMARMEDAMSGAFDANQENIKHWAQTVRRARAFTDIQKRGTQLPGDQGRQFGLGFSNHGQGFNLSPFGSFLGSRESFGGFFGPQGFGGLAGGLGNFGGQGSLSAFKASTRGAHFKMAMAVQAYKGFGVAKNVIDMMSNFAAEGLKIKHPSKNVEKFYNRWADHVGLEERVQAILRYYYKYANVFIYTTMGDIDKAAYDRMKRAKGRQNGDIKGFARADSNDPAHPDRVEDVKEQQEKEEALKQIPWRYTLLNPFQMDLKGNKFFGQQRWVFVLDEGTAKMVQHGVLRRGKRTVDFLDESDINLPPEFEQLAGKSEQDNRDPRVVDLDQGRLWTLHYMKDDHEDWADPLLWPVISDIHFKNKLRQMDISVCDSVINAVTIFKLGDFKNGFVPPKEHFAKFAEFLRTPTAAMNLIWNDAVSMESNYPPVEKILSIGKYESVDRDIQRGLGIPDSLIGGATTSNFSTGFLGVRTLLERLEEGRNAVRRWLERQLKMIAAIMGHRDVPRVRFGKMSLRDEKAEKQLVLALLDRNVISVEAVLECFGEDFIIELERLRDEKKIADKEGLLVKHGPFTDPMATMTDEDVMDREDDQMDKEADRAMKEKQADRRSMRKMERQGNKPTNPNGRPPNTEGIPQEKKRVTKPQGMAVWVAEYEKQKGYYRQVIDDVEKIVTRNVLTTRGKKYKKSLNKKDKQGIEDISFAVASYIDCLLPINERLVQDVLGRYGNMHRQTYDIYSRLTKKSMSIEQRKDAMASAIATYEMETL